ncbi:hypothetical protein [Paracoccus sp. MKU1]|uniref:hypothetical protein n=1 Tax=Paracoccus sp. MKU1 TaxID=1745182 RepID=UPI0007191DC8|nr:hypothetical protein [Paracoccus sp. MKU1]KRW95661.1 hypothetical protein AQY21_13195 [Paracoccus sp. MKU1]
MAAWQPGRCRRLLDREGHFDVAPSPALQRLLAQAKALSSVFPSDVGGGVGPLVRAALHAEHAAQIAISPAF